MLRERHALIAQHCDVTTLRQLAGHRVEARVNPRGEPSDLTSLVLPPHSGYSPEENSRIHSALYCARFQASTARFDPDDVDPAARETKTRHGYVVRFTFPPEP